MVGSLAGVSCWLFSYPQDVIKTKIQVLKEGTFPKNRFIPDGGFISCSKDIYAKLGIKGFWYGISPCMTRAVVANAFGIAAYEEAQRIALAFQSQS